MTCLLNWFTRRGIRHDLKQLKDMIMAALDDITAKVEALNAKTDQTNTALAGIRQDIADLKATIPPTGGLTEEQAQGVLASLTALETKVTATADAATALDLENPTAA